MTQKNKHLPITFAANRDKIPKLKKFPGSSEYNKTTTTKQPNSISVSGKLKTTKLYPQKSKQLSTVFFRINSGVRLTRTSTKEFNR